MDSYKLLKDFWTYPILVLNMIALIISFNLKLKNRLITDPRNTVASWKCCGNQLISEAPSVTETYACWELLKSLNQSSPLFSLLKASDCEMHASFGRLNIFFTFPSEKFSVHSHKIRTHDKKVNCRGKGGQQNLKVNRMTKILDTAAAENLLDKMVCATDKGLKYWMLIKEPDKKGILNTINKLKHSDMWPVVLLSVKSGSSPHLLCEGKISCFTAISSQRKSGTHDLKVLGNHHLEDRKMRRELKISLQYFWWSKFTWLDVVLRPEIKARVSYWG